MASFLPTSSEAQIRPRRPGALGPFLKCVSLIACVAIWAAILYSAPWSRTPEPGPLMFAGVAWVLLGVCAAKASPKCWPIIVLFFWAVTWSVHRGQWGEIVVNEMAGYEGPSWPRWSWYTVRPFNTRSYLVLSLSAGLLQAAWIQFLGGHAFPFFIFARRSGEKNLVARLLSGALMTRRNLLWGAGSFKVARLRKIKLPAVALGRAALSLKTGILGLSVL